MAELIHGTAIAVAGRAALIRGPTGSGKSDLALRCLAVAAGPLTPEAARLVADDQVLADLAGGRVMLSAPATIRGLIEVRGLGILAVPACDAAGLALVVDLVAAGGVERLPEPGQLQTVCGVAVPCMKLAPFEMSAPLKLLLALGDSGQTLPVHRNSAHLP